MNNKLSALLICIRCASPLFMNKTMNVTRMRNSSWRRLWEAMQEHAQWKIVRSSSLLWVGNSFICMALTGFVLRGSCGVKEGSDQALCFGVILWIMERVTVCKSLCYKDCYTWESVFPGEFFCQFQNFQCVALCMCYQTSKWIHILPFQVCVVCLTRALLKVCSAVQLMMKSYFSHCLTVFYW